MVMSDSDGLFPAVELEHVDPVDVGVEAGAGVNKRFRPFEPAAVMLVPPSLDEWLPQNHLSRFIADIVETQLDFTKSYASYAKTRGQPPYDPRLMVRGSFSTDIVWGFARRGSWNGCASMWSRFADWLRSRHRIFAGLPGFANVTSPAW